MRSLRESFQGGNPTWRGEVEGDGEWEYVEEGGPKREKGILDSLTSGLNREKLKKGWKHYSDIRRRVTPRWKSGWI